MPFTRSHSRCRLTQALLATVGLFALAASTHSQAQTALDDIMKNKEIKIAMPTDFPPYGFVGPDL